MEVAAPWRVFFSKELQRMPRQAVENEVQEFLQAHASVGASQDRQAVVGNGSLPARKILTGLGGL